MSGIDRAFVKKSFNASAGTYDDSAVLQQRLVGQVLQFAGDDPAAPERILDIGMGTGNLTAALAGRLPAAHIFGCDLAEKMVMLAAGKAGLARCRVCLTASDLPYSKSEMRKLRKQCDVRRKEILPLRSS